MKNLRDKSERDQGVRFETGEKAVPAGLFRLCPACIYAGRAFNLLSLNMCF